MKKKFLPFLASTRLRHLFFCIFAVGTCSFVILNQSSRSTFHDSLTRGRGTGTLDSRVQSHPYTLCFCLNCFQRKMSQDVAMRLLHFKNRANVHVTYFKL